MQVEVVSPETVLYSGEGEMVVCRTTDGDIAFLAGHASFIGALDIGKVRVILADGDEHTIAVHGGFVEVGNDKVIVLSDVAELPEQIDAGRAREAKQRAQSALAADSDDQAAKDALARANTRLEVAGAPD